MRRKTIDYWFDTIFWFMIITLPLFYVFLASKWDIQILQFNFDINGNFIAETLRDVAEGYFMITIDYFYYWYLSYVIITYIIHLLFDFLAFIPRLAHNLMNKFYNVGGLKE